MASTLGRDQTLLIPNSPPAKRQKTDTGYSSTSNSNTTTARNTSTYNSENDSGDDLFEGYIPDTPAAPSGKYETQPTQIIDRSAPSPSRLSSAPETPFENEIQVPASSPLSGKDSQSTKPQSSGIHGPVRNGSASQHRNVALNMAPAGTAYKPPHGIVRKPPPTNTMITIDDDHEVQVIDSDSSEDELKVKADIQPSLFKPRSAQSSFKSLSSANTANGNAKFQSIVSNSAYKGPGQSMSSSASMYGGQDRDYATNSSNTAKLQNKSMATSGGFKRSFVQTSPERATPIQDITLESLTDSTLREKVTRLKLTFPNTTYLTCKNALIRCRGNVDDAANLIAGIALSADDTNEAGSSQASLPGMRTPQKTNVLEQPQMKRTFIGNLASLKDRYSSTQAPAQKPTLSAIASQPPKPKKKLVQGRRHPSSPAIPAVSSPLKHQPSPVISLDEYDSDSGVASATEAEDPELEDRVLKFLNKCTSDELVELTSTTKAYAELMIAARPFRSCDAARCVANTTTTKTGKRSARGPIGQKIVDTAMYMFTGYEAIDALVKKCEQLGKPLFQEMSTWGFDTFGAAKGELEMTSFEDESLSQRDSGVGSPSSGAASLNGDADDDVKIISSTRKKAVNFVKQPITMSEDFPLKDYQLVGLNWLALMYRHKLSGILADEMGLGKTCQVIALLAHLVETGHNGPHLVICPGSTLENWLREIPRFAPSLAVDVYYGPLKERAEMAESILARRDKINVVVTTYDLAARPDDNKFMRRLKPDVCVYDEGHYLKNIKSQRYRALIKIPARFKLLLTGTPLQNNLQELASLLAFILPEVFQEVQEDLDFIFKTKTTTRDTDHGALLSAQRITRARSMLTPFVLRRKKQQVLKHLPPKTCRVEFCTLQPAQQKIYNGHVDQARERARIRIEGGKIPKSEIDENNPLMQLRKAAISDLLFRRHFNNEKIEKMADILRKQDPINFPSDKTHQRNHLVNEMRAGSDFWLHQWCRDYPCIASFDIPSLAWMESGKVQSLIKLVKGYKENGDRVLIFSQFSLVLDILESVLNSSLISFTRIDGSTKIDERQTLIDTFRDDTEITAFLLTTKAGGTGINLMFANKVIIFDGSFNPQDDKQAENRAHRVGQTREVEVVRLVTRNTIEEQIYALGVSKLSLDRQVAGDEVSEAKGEQDVARMFLEAVALDEEDTKPTVEGAKKDKGEKGEEKAVVVDDGAKKHGRLPKRKKSSILDMVRKKDPDKISKKKGSTAEKCSEIIEVDEEGNEILV